MTVETVGYASHGAAAHLRPYEFDQRGLRDGDVHLEVEFCGICHSDVHCVRGDWGPVNWPVVPGHEIVGTVKGVGAKVQKFKAGDRVGVGCLVDSCRDCLFCNGHDEQLCDKRILTYGSLNFDGTKTFGGYSSDMVVEERFVLRIPNNLDPCGAAPLLCAGITTFNPMRLYGMDEPGKKIGVVGLGGLGHMAVKFGRAFKNEVVVISHSPSKRQLAMDLGASIFVLSSSDDEMKMVQSTLDFIVDTVCTEKNMDAYLALLKPKGVLVTVGAPPSTVKLTLSPMSMIMYSKTVAGSLIGGLKATQEMLDFCGEHGIVSDVEKVSMDYVNDAYTRILKSDVRFRFVLDVKNTMPKKDSFKPIPTAGYAALECKGKLVPFKYEMRPLTHGDVHIKVKFCGVCHSDIHQVQSDWNPGIFPMVPGHEIVGVVDSIGAGVTKFRKGDLVGVGCMVDCCRDCDQCSLADEQYCKKGAVFTYNALDYSGRPTFGGYGKDLVVSARFVMKIPCNLDPCGAAPLLCAGITTYSPMKRFKMDEPGKRIGVVGLGGLGHMAVKFGRAWNNEVVVISHSASKKQAAMLLGAMEFVVSSCPEEMARIRGTLDFIIDTVCVQKDMNALIGLLKPRGVLVTVGVPEASVQLNVNPFALIGKCQRIAGSLIGGTAQTQEMLNFCGDHNIVASVERIKLSEINEAYVRMGQSDVRYRFVLDVEGSDV